MQKSSIVNIDIPYLCISLYYVQLIKLSVN